MKRITSITTVLALVFLFNISNAFCGNITGAWCGKILGSRIDVTFVQDKKEFKGVANLTDIMGAKNTYHVAGSVLGDKVKGRHGSGHTFAGKLVNPNTIEVVLTLKSGKTFEVELERVHTSSSSHKADT